VIRSTILKISFIAFLTLSFLLETPTNLFAGGPLEGEKLEDGIILGPRFKEDVTKEEDRVKSKVNIESVINKANSGDAQSQFVLAQQLLIDSWLSKNSQTALHYIKLASDQGHKDAHLMYLGLLYKGSDGVQKDEAGAYQGFKKLADQPDPNPFLRIGMQGVIKPEVPQGDIYSRYRVGKMHLIGRGCTKDLRVALEYLEPLPALLYHEWLHDKICYQIGNIYSELGNKEEALKYYNRASGRTTYSLNGCRDSIVAKAHYKVATLLLEQSGGNPTPAVVKAYQKVADLSYKVAGENPNIIEARWKLGDAYRFGRGVTPNLHKAKKYYKKASKNGNEYAKQALEELNAAGDGLFSQIKQLSIKLDELCRTHDSGGYRIPNGCFFNKDSFSAGAKEKSFLVLEEFVGELDSLWAHLAFPQPVLVTCIQNPADVKAYVTASQERGELHETKFENSSYFTIEKPYTDEWGDELPSEFREFTVLNTSTEELKFDLGRTSFKLGLPFCKYNISDALCQIAMRPHSWNIYAVLFETPSFYVGSGPTVEDLPQISTAQVPAYIKYIQSKYEEALQSMETSHKELSWNPDHEQNAKENEHYTDLEYWTKSVHEAFDGAKNSLKEQIELAREALKLLDEITKKLHAHLRDAGPRNEAFMNDPWLKDLLRH
jgi:TPR repeat protein